MTKLKTMRKPNSSSRRWPKANSGNPFGCPLGNRNQANPSPEDSTDRAAGEIFRFCLQIAKATKNRALLRRLDRMTEALPSMSFRKIAAMGDDPLALFAPENPIWAPRPQKIMSLRKMKP